MLFCRLGEVEVAEGTVGAGRRPRLHRRRVPHQHLRHGVDQGGDSIEKILA